MSTNYAAACAGGLCGEWVAGLAGLAWLVRGSSPAPYHPGGPGSRLRTGRGINKPAKSRPSANHKTNGGRAHCNKRKL